MTHPITGAEYTRWDLSVFYSDLDDPQLDEDIAFYKNKAQQFHVQYKGNLAHKLGLAINDYAELTMFEHKISGYLALRQSLNVEDAEVKAKCAEADRIFSDVNGTYLTFFDLELVALDEAILEQLYEEDPIVARYRPWIEHTRAFKQHLLKEDVESALTKRSPFGPDAWSEFYDEFEAALEFEYMGEKLTLTELLNYLESRDVFVRDRALVTLNTGLGGIFAQYVAQTLSMVTGSNSVENKERAYRYPMDARNKSNRVPDAVVDSLHAAVCDVGGSLASRYYQLKAAHLRVSTLRWSDRNAPMPFADTTTIAFEEALDIVIAAYESFSPTLAALIRDFMQLKRIDAPALKGKSSGAFNSSFILPGNHPVSFSFLNYLGSASDVMTLAHELGHGVHGMLAARAQGVLMFDAPTVFSETASVFGEMTTFNLLRNRLKASDQETQLLALLMEKISDMLDTVVRQIGFSNFERRIHGMDASYSTWEEPKRLSVAELNTIWLETLQELYGPEGTVFTYKNAEHLWSYLSHFHQYDPFYVYGYAFGELLTQSLYAKQSKLGKRFEPLYLEFLSSGSTRNAIELLKPFGLDPTKKQFWVTALMTGLGALIQEAEELSQAHGIKVLAPSS